MVTQPHDATCTPTYLADDLGLDVADVEVVLRWLDMTAVVGRTNVEQAVEVASMLDPRHERRVPELYGQAAVDWRDDVPPRPHGLGSPTG
ncbi:hypothetical protein ACVGOW_04580 [Pseudonocardia saturnea]